jgi:hypothetical protein
LDSLERTYFLHVVFISAVKLGRLFDIIVLLLLIIVKISFVLVNLLLFLPQIIYNNGLFTQFQGK